MGRAATTTSIPGEPAPQDPADTAGATDQAQATDTAADPRDAEIARLRAELAAKNAPAAPQLIIEGDGPNIRKAMAESKHLHLTTAELDKQVRAGEVTLTDHHVLCKDGWYVNPVADARGRQG